MPTIFDGLVLAALILQVALPLALIGYIALRAPRDRLRLLLDVAFVALYLGAIAMAGLWLAFPRWLVGVEGALLAGALVVRVRGGAARGRSHRGHPGSAGATRGPRARALPWIRLGAVLCAASVLMHALWGRRPLPGSPVELTLPLAGGPYRVVAGGSVALLNPHLGTLHAARARLYRGQSYGVDLVRVGGWGSRRSLGAEEGPEAWAVFGEPVRAPCSGSVVFSADGEPDRRPAGTAPATLEGNHVILACRGAWVILAHMARESVAVAAGDGVETGDILGRVGNSGNSDEPHLHIHAQMPGSPEARLSGAPLPITFDGHTPVRNDRVHGELRDTTSGFRPSSPTAGPDDHDD